MRGSGNPEKFLVGGTRRFLKGFLGHVQRVGLFSGHYKQRSIDKFNVVGGVPAHQFHEAACGVTEGGIGMPMRLSVVHHAFTVEIGGDFTDAFVRQRVKIDIAGITDFPCRDFLGARIRL